MNLSGILRMHVEIVRKHWLLVIVVGAIVVALFLPLVGIMQEFTSVR